MQYFVSTLTGHLKRAQVRRHMPFESSLHFARVYQWWSHDILTNIFPAIPKPVGLYPLNKAFGSKDAGPNHENGVLSNVELASGPDGKSALIAQFMIMMYGFYVYRLTISLMFFSWILKMFCWPCFELIFSLVLNKGILHWEISCFLFPIWMSSNWKKLRISNDNWTQRSVILSEITLVILKANEHAFKSLIWFYAKRTRHVV